MNLSCRIILISVILLIVNFQVKIKIWSSIRTVCSILYIKSTAIIYIREQAVNCSMREHHLVEDENKGTQLVPVGMQAVWTTQFPLFLLKKQIMKIIFTPWRLTILLISKQNENPPLILHHWSTNHIRNPGLINVFKRSLSCQW